MSNIKSAVQLATALQIYAQKDLQKTKVSTNNIDALLTKAGIRAGSFDSRFPALFSFHGIDVKHTLEQAVREKEITRTAADYATQGMYNAMGKLAETYPVLTVDKWMEIEAAIEAFIGTVIEGSQVPQELSSTVVQNMRAKYENLRNIFSKAMLVSYTEAGKGKEPSVRIVHNSFSNFRDTINKVIKREILAVLKENNVTNSKLLDSNFLTTKVLNWGHTRTGESIISGKLIASLISLRNLNPSNEVMQVITRDFIKETGQINTEIKLHRGDLTKGDTRVLQLVINSSYLQKVLVQYAPYNQGVLSQQEIRWNLAEAIKRNPELKKALGVNSIEQLAEKLVKDVRSSPTTLEDIARVYVDGLTGKKSKSTKSEKTIPVQKTKVKLTSKKVQVKLKPSVAKTPKAKKITIAKAQESLATLQYLINSMLAETIKRNMGDGSRRDILNLRSGRFADSAVVTKMSESREGMITAFYTYMKYPYQTFEPGYRQGRPETRNPKLLISKSIREIAAEKAANRLRAVSV